MSAYQQVFLPTAWGKSTREPSVPGAFFMGPSDLQRQPKTDSLSGAQKKNPQDQNGPRGSRNGSGVEHGELLLRLRETTDHELLSELVDLCCFV